MVRTPDKQFSIISDQAEFRAKLGWILLGIRLHSMVFSGNKGWPRSAGINYLIMKYLALVPNHRIEVGGEVFEFSSVGFAKAYADASARCAE